MTEFFTDVFKGCGFFDVILAVLILLVILGLVAQAIAFLYPILLGDIVNGAKEVLKGVAEGASLGIEDAKKERNAHPSNEWKIDKRKLVLIYTAIGVISFVVSVAAAIIIQSKASPDL